MLKHDIKTGYLVFININKKCKMQQIKCHNLIT